MKTLYLLRHAKSSEREDAASGRERTLSEQGHKQADAVSDHLSSLLPPPSKVLCSPAARARATLRYFLEVWPQSKEGVSYPESLLQADAAALLKQFQSLSDEVDIVLLVGHNPGISEFGAQILEDASFAEELTPCTFLQVDCEVESWADLQLKTGSLKLRIHPANLDV